MDPGDAFFRWDPRPSAPVTSAPHQHRHVHPAEVELDRPRDLIEVFHGYGVRPLTVSRIAEMGFTSSTLAGMRDEELDEMMSTLSHLFRWDLLVGERYGIKASIRAERRRLESLLLLLHHHQHHLDPRRRLHDQPLDALSQEGGGLPEEPVPADSGKGKQLHRGSSSKRKTKKKKKEQAGCDDEEEEEEESESETAGSERQREHPFIVTEPGEVARAKKNGLDYLFHLYEQCREFLHQVQAMAKDTGDKCPTKVTNQVFRYAKRMGASYINKPKMRHYVHCYALHCLDEEVSNELRRGFKDRGENVGAWRQACYKPLVAISARNGWDIDAVFNAHPRLSIWYVPTKLRQMCYLARSSAAAGLLPPPTTTAAPMF